MRIALLLAASALLAGCSSGANTGAPSATVLSATTPTTSTPTSSRSTTSAPRPAAPGVTTAPAPGAAVADVIAWIEAGAPVDAASYQSMTRSGVSTPVTDGVAFTTAGTEANCVTNRYRDGALACLIKLTTPPPRPSGIESAWKNNWVDFDGTVVDVGSPHGDPGPFGDGTGAELPPGGALAFGDYRCRPDVTGLYCVNYAHQSAVRLAATGVEPFGCLKKTTPPADIGVRFTC